MPDYLLPYAKRKVLEDIRIKKAPNFFGAFLIEL